MKNNTVSRRERRTALLGSVIILAAVVVFRGIPLWHRWTSGLNESAAALIAEVAAAENDVENLGILLDSLEARKGRFMNLAPLLAGVGQPASASGALASLVAGLADAAGVRVTGIQVRVDTAGQFPLRRVSLSLDAMGDVRGFTELLFSLERGEPLLAIRELSISQPQPAATDEEPEVLPVRLRLEGLMLEVSTKGDQ